MAGIRRTKRRATTLAEYDRRLVETKAETAERNEVERQQERPRAWWHRSKEGKPHLS